MPTLSREIALSLYRWSTTRTRMHLAKQFEASGTYPAAILFYHRVADSHPNGWTISNSNFAQHLDWVQQNARFASLSDIRKSQRNGHRTVAMVSLTFDDGYSENCEKAIPTILERKIPCTYFVSTHFVETGEPFPTIAQRGFHSSRIRLKRFNEWHRRELRSAVTRTPTWTLASRFPLNRLNAR